MKKNKIKRRKRIVKILTIIVGIIVCLNLIGFAINKIFYSKELDAIVPYGQLIEVNGKKMHVYAMGNGEKTIVLLPGFGISLPSADFGPLMRELSREYTVVCLEYFGMGFSEQTDTPRTNSQITEEIRTSLSSAGFTPPYILMPHSASGIYSEYYAAAYPEEVSAIIFLDSTSTAIREGRNLPKFIYGISMVQQECGLTRISYQLVPPSQKIENGYTEKEINDYKLFTFHVLNSTMIDQSYRMLDNIKEVNTIPFPQNIPVLKIITSQTLEKMGEDYQNDHLNRLGSNTESLVINGTHFIYQTNIADIFQATQSFLEKID